MVRFRKTLLVVAALLAAGTAVAGSDAEFSRVDTTGDGRPRALQLGINHYVRDDGATVDLIGAVHVGDRAYYAGLNARFRDYDALLFELVAPPDADFAHLADRGKGLLSTTQVGLTKLLGLTFQLDEIDYGQANFVHADLSPSELHDSMVERNESLYVYFWRVFFASIDEYARDPLGLRDLEVLSSMIATGERPSMKVLMAYEMTDMRAVRDLLGEDSDSAIVGARNERAIEVLRRELDAGSKRLGIFYGVAHMPDLAERLVDGLGFEHAGTDWVDAWLLVDDE